MQTINIDGTTYKLKFDRDPMEIMKLARKAYKPKKPKDIRKFPTWLPNMSTGAYVREFIKLNNLTTVKYDYLNFSGTAVYDTSIPLFEILPDAEA